MRSRKHEREYKRQRGQYMTPLRLAREIVSRLEIERYDRILEPSCGDGAFLSAIADKLADVSDANIRNRDVEILGIEIDPLLVDKSRTITESNLSDGILYRMKVNQADFFKEYLASTTLGDNDDAKKCLQRESFDLVIGNPPFGGTFDHSIEDVLDTRLGTRLGKKIKKETYAFFIVACLDLLRMGGRLLFLCSDTLLTIPTMMGLRQFLMQSGDVKLYDVDDFSDETDYPILLLDFTKRGHSGKVERNSQTLDASAIRATPNLSWGITPELAKLFSSSLLGDYFIASSGMTTGRNELFIREIDEFNRIIEPYRFEFYDAPVTLSYELERARLGRLSAKRKRELILAEARGDTERRLRISKLDEPETVQLPDARYRPYNKANSHLVFSEPTHCIYWENDGDAVLTYKRTGNWYLRGVGGQPHFGREGVTWPLVATRFNPRFMPSGYILDSGAPCAFVRKGVNRDEIFFAIGWLLTDLANRVLKTVINHTRNIQSKDFERMPYPWWVTDDSKAAVVSEVKSMITDISKGRRLRWRDRQARRFDNLFAFPDGSAMPQKSEIVSSDDSGQLLLL